MVLTANDFQKLLGKTAIVTVYASLDVSALGAVIALQGENQSWNITGRNYFKVDSVAETLLSYPGGAPRANDPAFAGCNLVMRSKSLWTTTDMTEWRFLTLAETALLAHGTVIDSAGFDRPYLENSPPLCAYKFPLSYGASWTTTSTSIYYNGMVITDTQEITVDGYGTITTPEGTFPCLRLRKKAFSEISMGPIRFVTTSYLYYFIGNDPTTGIVEYGGISADSTNAPTAVSYGRTRAVASVQQPITATPTQFELAQNYPNPFNPSTTIEFCLPRPNYVTLQVFAPSGEEVATLKAEYLPSGRYSILWNPRDLASGVYFYRLQAGDFVQTKKLVLLK
ncbi:MAG: T9SS type A sorting domain-containing protein [candidate division KSB1 bacterium]|nr:T9SS type A sorting domain-containing protein [candidate division KSB1 bacterium]MDZ7385768.1 T9SS type A sorting domain-containing protein [candidate division KSB1 bacterium]MDZ7391359.1 T9SS type A sorting domain-containing protein [candidate division KSB1 bacterium]